VALGRQAGSGKHWPPRQFAAAWFTTAHQADALAALRQQRQKSKVANLLMSCFKDFALSIIKKILKLLFLSPIHRHNGDHLLTAKGT